MAFQNSPVQRGIPFYAIPEEIRIEIIQKMKVGEFANVQHSSPQLLHDSQKIRSKIFLRGVTLFTDNTEMSVYATFVVNGIKKIVPLEDLLGLPLGFDIQMIQINGSLRKEAAAVLRKFFLETNSVAEKMKIRNIRCTKDAFSDLMDALKVKKFECVSEFHPIYISAPAMKNVSDINVSCSLIDEDLLFLMAPTLFLENANISSVGINYLLKEWIQGEREIDQIFVQNSTESLSKEWIFDGMAYSNGENRSIGEEYTIERGKGERLNVRFTSYFLHISKLS